MATKDTNINKQDNYIIIPNPIYDVVFKYLMEDNESAKIIISTLINEKIIHLQFDPISHAQTIIDPDKDIPIKLFHLDFTATIALPDGTEELIMIEIQKAQRVSDIFRFKRYISANFQKKQETEIIDPETQAVKKINKPIRLIPIFILNFRIETEINDLIIKINRIKTGIFKQAVLKKHNEFIDNLSYDMIVVQLPNLHNIEKSEYKNDKYKTKLYSMLKLFDQQAKIKENTHRLLLLRSTFPGFLERIINRLKSADSDYPDLEEQMNVEDEYLAELEENRNKVTFYKQKIEQKDQELVQKDKELMKNKQELEHNKQTIIDLAKILKESGVPIEKIQQKTNLSNEDIKKL
ncbi:MAG: hypothetical protein HY738_15520 [Bacteroidia bacterium]|nr:hypothetical protein [Bacteroidia bacterium]